MTDLELPVALVPIDIPKPWGRERWFTGIEARGESLVRTAKGTLPISAYLAAGGTAGGGSALLEGRSLLLLKILDPNPEPVLGDLYFEVHQEKREVYVVTHVDRAAWPHGIGAVRFGMNPGLRAEYADDDAFRGDYLRAVTAYERVRRAIDAGESIAPAVEQQRRAEMERFTALRPLRPGAVVTVPPWTPHALQHGVRVVEFQTPTYERYILSFAQQVLTQPHWDTAYAVPRMQLDTPAEPEPEHVGPGLERLARFPDFEVLRARVRPGFACMLPIDAPYLLCMAERAAVCVGGIRLEPEQAALLPGPWLRRFRPNGVDHAGQHDQRPQIEAAGAEPATCLLARMII